MHHSEPTEWLHEIKGDVLTLFRLPGPVLIIVYKLSPELFESEGKEMISYMKKYAGESFQRVGFQMRSTNLQGWA